MRRQGFLFAHNRTIHPMNINLREPPLRAHYRDTDHSGVAALNADPSALFTLKNQLLREALDGATGTFAGILRLAAAEAEAQAWLSSYPLLTFPALFEEKVAEVRTYAARQQRLRSRCRTVR